MPNVSANIDTLLLSADNAAARTNLGVSKVISTPKVYYVETTGNDATAQVGNPASPYATADAAYAAGVTAAVDFKIALGVGAFSIGSNLAIGYLQQVSGCGANMTSLTIGAYPTAADPAVAGYTLTLETTDISLTVNSLGGGHTGVGNGGNGPLVDLKGSNCDLSVDVSGGAAADGNGGDGGVVRCYGGFTLVYFTAGGGAGGNGGNNGAVGGLEIDGCNLINCSYGSTPTPSTVARSSYVGANLTPTNNLGGNAVY